MWHSSHPPGLRKPHTYPLPLPLFFFSFHFLFLIYFYYSAERMLSASGISVAPPCRSLHCTDATSAQQPTPINNDIPAQPIPTSATQCCWAAKPPGGPNETNNDSQETRDKGNRHNKDHQLDTDDTQQDKDGNQKNNDSNQQEEDGNQNNNQDDDQDNDMYLTLPGSFHMDSIWNGWIPWIPYGMVYKK